MDKLLVFVLMLFATILAIAYPNVPKRISGELKIDFKGIGNNRPTRVDSIPGKCEEIEICKLYGNFKVCKKMQKCTQ